MTLRGLISVLLGKVERPIFVSYYEFDALYYLFPYPITYIGEVEDRIDHYCSTQILIDGLDREYILGSAFGYFYEKQDFHSLTDIEEIELKMLEQRYP